MSALQSLQPDDPGMDIPAVSSPLEAADPISDMGVTNNAINNLRSDAILQRPDDTFNKYLMGMLPDAQQMAQQKAALISAQQAEQQTRDGYLNYLQQQVSPERESALNWQGLGDMFAGWSTGDWGAGARNYQEARNANRQTLEKSNDTLNSTKLALAKSDTADALSQYNLLAEDRKLGLKSLLDYYKEIAKERARGRAPKIVTDQTGATWLVDIEANTKQPITGSNGLTPQDQTALGEYYKQLSTTMYPGDMARVNSEYQKEVERRRTANKQMLGTMGPAGESAAPSEELPYSVVIDPNTPPEEADKIRRQARDDYEASNPRFGLFDKSDMATPSGGQPQGMSPAEVELWKQNQGKFAEEAMKDEAAARATLSQTQAMYENTKSALAIGAKTGATQPLINGIGAVFQSLGLDEGIARESIKGTTFQSIQNQAIQVLQNAAKGVQTEGDAKRFAASLAQVKNPAEANQLILKFMEAQLWKREQELTFRSTYSAVNPSPAGASAKWSNWSRQVPAIQDIHGKPVFVHDYIRNYVDHNQEAVNAHSKEYVEREALKAWRNRQN